jgi:hypothetical protein
MATLSLDTDPAIEKLQIEDLRRMPPWRKVALVCDRNLPCAASPWPAFGSATRTTAPPNASAAWPT